MLITSKTVATVAGLEEWGKESALLAESEEKWIGEFVFSISGPCPPDEIFFHRQDKFTLVNVFADLTNVCYMNHRLYFDPTKYEVKSDAGITRLLDDLVKHAPSQGCHLVKRDKRKNPNWWKLTCSCFREYVTSVDAPRDTYAFRTGHVRNDRRAGSRGSGGQKLPKKTNSVRPMAREDVCPFKFTIFEGDDAYFLKAGVRANNNEHNGHRRLGSNRAVPITKLKEVTSLQIKTVHSLIKSGLSNQEVCSFMKENEGTKIRPHHVRFFTQQLLFGNSLDETKTGSEVLGGLVACRHDFVTLVQHSKDSPTTAESSVKESTTIKNLGSPSGPFKDYLDSKRIREGLADNDALLLGVIWVSADERSLFEKFPNVVKIDTTFGTNNQGLPLVVISGLTANNEVFTIARGNLPNERAFVFKWLFQNALPALFPAHLLKRVRIIISDGDSQEISQINAAISPGGPLEFSRRLQCAYHIIDRSWNAKVYHLGKKVDEGPNRFFESLRRLVMHWLYSWCTPSCETELEYKISKCLLKHYLQSKHFQERIGRHYSNVMDWFRSVESTIEVCLFYKRKTLAAFEQYTNSSAEANFSSLKFGYSKVNKRMGVARSNFHLNIQADEKTSRIRDKAVTDLDRSCVWSQIPHITSHLSTHGAGIFESEYNKRFDYRSRRDGDVFLVSPISSVDDIAYSEMSAPFIPSFRRVRRLAIETFDDGRRVLRCDCCSSERNLLVCRHQLHIIDKYFDLSLMHYTSLNHPHWWASFAVHAYPSKNDRKETSHTSLSEKLEQVSETYDLVGYYGPSLALQTATQTAIDDEPRHFKNVPIHESISNWSSDNVLSVAPELCRVLSRTEFDCIGIDENVIAQYSEPLLGMSQTLTVFDDDPSTHCSLLPTSQISYPESVESMWEKRFDDVMIKSRKISMEQPHGVFQVLNPMFKELVSVLELNPGKLEERIENFEWMIADTSIDETGVKRAASQLSLTVPKRMKHGGMVNQPDGSDSETN
jgi:hypothetical protein